MDNPKPEKMKFQEFRYRPNISYEGQMFELEIQENLSCFKDVQCILLFMKKLILKIFFLRNISKLNQ